MRATELRQETPEALRRRAADLLSEISALRFGGQEKVKNVKKRRELRRERARALTILREKGER